MLAEMKASELFSMTKNIWQGKIHVVIRNANDNYDVLWPITNAYEKIDKQVDQNDYWLELGLWSLYQGVTELAKGRAKEKSFYISAEDVSLNRFAELVLENLGNDSWKKERLSFIDDSCER